MAKDIGQYRAAHWLKAIDKGPKLNWADADTEIKGFPAMIRNSGLGLAIATFKTATTRKREKAFIIDALADWLLCHREQNGSPYGNSAQSTVTAADLMDKIREGSVDSYMVAVSEAMAWIEWGKPLLAMQKAKYSETETSSEEPHNPDTEDATSEKDQA
ncbi:MAG: type III-B CRISPR module-associated protein Cmr5 [Parvularcula sp.]